MPRHPKIRWAPRPTILASARRIAIFGGVVLVPALALDAGPFAEPVIPWVIVAALFAAGGWVWAGAMIRAQHPTVVTLGLASLLPISAAWGACWVLPPLAFLASIERGAEPLALGAAIIGGAAIGWGGAQWSLASLAQMVRQMDPDADPEPTVDPTER